MSRRREMASWLERSRRVRFGRGVGVLVVVEEDDMKREVVTSASAIRSGDACHGIGLGVENALEDEAARAAMRAESWYFGMIVALWTTAAPRAGNCKRLDLREFAQEEKTTRCMQLLR
mmetsp:Transcript_5659/g.12276  ORF Transcript_5659/g.12276 Transcript_5659/m.12276 type:complete len:118 (+) Transcript_5659:1108-1461(+)